MHVRSCEFASVDVPLHLMRHRIGIPLTLETGKWLSVRRLLCTACHQKTRKIQLAPFYDAPEDLVSAECSILVGTRHDATS